ncbi:class I SAM-dependent methyltransferase [Aquirufa regiilacus]|uniref:Class I SAM-dependent methyltransferase n=1 Tax=Aquirufa regiilacus TaxID=3024868 RepID=A0ABU3TSG0_9BACT|nr:MULTISPECIES: class I SAM-dependent methyltransferase [unclassified Aquirufa]MDT8886481.1 class I SAM-dependent methyltransferase [Aquirufa sp. LEPPI-3A]MDU0808811.1 class I SAM-dependent methyltransferase [Aquirufa sp. LEOWEIH-7C]
MGKATWFSTWFDSPYYHLLYASRDEQEAKHFIEALQAHLKIATGAFVLDAACGKGRHAKMLQRHGMEVEGFDLSPSSIAEANRLANKHLHFFVHDLREPLPKQAQYDVVFNFFTSFGYFDAPEDNARAFQTFAGGLKKDGILVMDFLNPTYIRTNLVPEETVKRGSILFHIKRWEAGGYLYKSIDFEDQGQSFAFQEKVELISQADFLKYAEQAGLTFLNLAGDYTLAKFDEQTSPRMIFFWEKK